MIASFAYRIHPVPRVGSNSESTPRPTLSDLSFPSLSFREIAPDQDGLEVWNVHMYGEPLAKLAVCRDRDNGCCETGTSCCGVGTGWLRVFLRYGLLGTLR